MSVAVFLHASKVVDSKIVEGMLMYPTSFGYFKSEKDREAFTDLFEGQAPPVPYGGIGKRYGKENFTLKEVQSAVLHHMKKNFSAPKDEDTYWELDGHMHDNLVFHPAAMYGIVAMEESDDEAAIRTIWEYTGMRVDRKELVRGKNVEDFLSPTTVSRVHQMELPVLVYHVNVSIYRAKYDWITHQTEKRTLTDWDVSPYKEILGDLRISEIIHNAYCKTTGGPRFVSSLEEVKDTFTQRLMAKAGVGF
jgi:hypothetical protein